MNRKTKIKSKSKHNSKNKPINTVRTTLDKVIPSAGSNYTKPTYLELPVAHIKSDLIGIILFALFAFGLIFLLKHYNITLDLVLSYISTTFIFF